jgi:hypothetical protein
VLVASAFQTLVAGESAAKPAIRARSSKSPITISFTSMMRQGNLVVEIDGVPVFNEKFQKPFLLISQTTTWDPLQVTPGKHRLSAKVYGTKKTYLGDLRRNVSRTKGSELRFVMKATSHCRGRPDSCGFVPADKRRPSTNHEPWQ